MFISGLDGDHSPQHWNMRDVCFAASHQPGSSKTQSKLGMQMLAKAHSGPVGWSCLNYGYEHV